MPDIYEIKSLDPGVLVRRHTKAALDLQRALKETVPIISVAGNIGFGKSSVTDVLTTHGAVGIYERTEDPMLELYYGNRRAYGFGFQIHVSARRAAASWNAVELRARRRLASCIDRTGYEEPRAFVPALNEMGDITDDEVERLEAYFNLQFTEGKEARREYERLAAKRTRNGASLGREAELIKWGTVGSPPPDLVIFLHGPREVAWERVRSRGAEYERLGGQDKSKGLPEALHEALHRAYDRFPKGLRESGWFDGPIVEIDQGQVSIAETTGQTYLLEALVQALEKQGKFPGH